MRGAGDGPGWEGCWGSEVCVCVGTGIWAGPEKGRGLELQRGGGAWAAGALYGGRD